MMRCTLLILALVFMLISHADSQKFLIIEKAGSPKTERIAIFDELKFQLKDDDKGWYTRQIMDLNADAQLLLLGDTWIPVQDIARIHLKRQRAIANILGGAMQGGGASMILGDTYYTVVRNEPQYTEGGMEFGAVNLLVGTLVRALWRPVKYKLGNKKRLRVIDITFRSTDKT